MIRAITQSISGKLRVMVLAVTFIALLVSGGTMLVYDIRSHQKEWIDDLMTQADIVGRTTAPALQFNDPGTALDNLAVLKVRPNILAAAIYTQGGAVFASYWASEAYSSGFPKSPGMSGFRIDGDEMLIYHPIVEKQEVVGTVYLRARYELRERLKSYAAILTAVMVGSMILAAIVSLWLQASVTKSILAVTGVAREVMQRRDFSLRAQKSTEDEIGVLVDAFNGMLNEVSLRTRALEEANRTLEHEMKERREAEEALRIADRRKDEFLATLAHELRNPLAPMSNGLAIMNLAGNNAAVSKNARDIMERQLDQMVRLIDDLLDVSRISTGKLAIRKERVELQSVVRNAIETVAAFMEVRAHTLAIELSAEPILLDGDATRLAQIFANLLNNAAKYSNPGGRIAFHAGIEEKQVVIKVSDNGIGISEDMLTSIFDMFTQADYSLERSQAGLGVGLTLAKRLVELHGGTIEAHSAGTDQGSTFIVRLPIVSDAAPAAIEKRSSDAGRKSSQYRILLADDNVDFATSLADLLRDEGHEVHVTHDGAEALDAAARFKPEFAFLDIGLPKLNGYDLARRLREQPFTSDSILVAITGWGQEKDRRLASQAGFDHHMVKPVAFGQLLAIIRNGCRPVSD
jgi:signal transduction histidine kinase/ActR/RegA family two-component response regulator